MPISAHESPRMGTDTWLTPPEILAALGPFDLDPCTPDVMPWATAARRYTEADDGLAQPWCGRVWLNPPYGKALSRWLARMADHDHGTALIFARTETAAFFRYVWERAGAALFLQGRLHFHLPDGTRAAANSGAPSVLVAYGLHDVDALAECGIDGAFVPLSCIGQTVAVLRHDDGLTWRALIEELARRQGGTLTLEVAYALVRGHPKARRNPHWRAKVRQTLQQAGRRTGPAQYRLL